MAILIKEKLFDVSKGDLELIYYPIRNTIKEVLDVGFECTIDKMKILSNKSLLIKKIKSNRLKSPDCVSANKDNSVNINLIIGDFNSSYDPKTREINIVIQSKALSYLDYLQETMDFEITYNNLRQILSLIQDNDIKSFVKLELLEESRKANIYHEVSHWLDDSKNNRHILKLHTNLNNDKKALNNYISKYKLLYLTPIEINAQLHSIYSLRQSKTDAEWDSMSIIDVIGDVQGLESIFRQLVFNIRNGEKDYIEILKLWLRLILKRLSREDFLGRNMNYIPRDVRSVMLENKQKGQYFDVSDGVPFLFKLTEEELRRITE